MYIWQWKTPVAGQVMYPSAMHVDILSASGAAGYLVYAAERPASWRTAGPGVGNAKKHHRQLIEQGPSFGCPPQRPRPL